MYSAVWFRALGTQGEDALLEDQECHYSYEDTVLFSARGCRLASPGWHQLTSRLFLEPNQELRPESLSIVEGSHVEHTSKPPHRHSASSILAWLDDKMIGRPRNYASVIPWLLTSGFATAHRGRIHISPKGEAVVTFLRKAAPDLIDPDFHAEVEEGIDAVASGSSYSSFAQFYWEWATSSEEKMASSSLRAQFKSPEGKKPVVWVAHSGVVARSSQEDWSVPVSFDARGRIVTQESL